MADGMDSDDLKDADTIDSLVDSDTAPATGTLDDRSSTGDSGSLDTTHNGRGRLTATYEPPSDAAPEAVERLGDAFQTWLEHDDIMPHKGWNRTYDGYTTATRMLDREDYSAADLYRFCDDNTFRGGRDGVFIQAAVNALEEDHVILPELATPELGEGLEDEYSNLHETVRSAQDPEEKAAASFETYDDLADELAVYQELQEQVIREIEEQTSFEYPEPLDTDRQDVPPAFYGIGHRNDTILLIEGGDLGKVGWHNDGTILLMADEDEIELPGSSNDGTIYTCENIDYNQEIDFRRSHPPIKRRERLKKVFSR